MELVNNFAPFVFLPLFVLVPVTLAMRRRLLLILMSPLAIVGVFWFGPYYLPKEKSKLISRPLSVVTFNVSRCNRNMNEVERWLRLTDAQLVMLQELPEGYATNGIIGLKEMYPFQIREPIHFRSYGNMVLSKYPVVKTEYLAMGDGEQAYWTQKLIVNVRTQRIAVYNVHFANPFRGGVYVSSPNYNFIVSRIPRYDNGRRDAQIRRLLNKLKIETLPFIVAGDFNMTDQAAMYDSLIALMHDAFRDAGIGMGPTWPIPVSGKFPAIITPLFRIDYILHSADFRAGHAERGPVLGSDHLPVYATLQLAPTTGTDVRRVYHSTDAITLHSP